MLKAKAGGSIAGIDTSALKRAETAVETLKSEFHSWVRDDVAKLDVARDAFARSPDARAREKLYRVSLDMTGQADTFEFPLVARVAKSLCDLVVDAPADIPMSLVDAHVNAIRIIFRDNIKSQDNPTAVELASELEGRVAELVQGSSAA
jgi:hypothetical protein